MTEVKHGFNLGFALELIKQFEQELEQISEKRNRQETEICLLRELLQAYDLATSTYTPGSWDLLQHLESKMASTRMALEEKQRELNEYNIRVGLRERELKHLLNVIKA